MKSLTLKYLSTAIALPLFAWTLSVATPADAEQIGRSRSITTEKSNREDLLPSVTDLNLSVPVVGGSGAYEYRSCIIDRLNGQFDWLL